MTRPSPELLEECKRFAQAVNLTVLITPQANPGPRRSWDVPDDSGIVFIDHVGLLR